MARKLQKLINYHTSGTGMPASGDVALGEIVVRHNNEKPELLIEKNDGSFATFIDSNAVDLKVNAEKTRAEGAEEALSDRIDSLSGLSHSHDNKGVLDGISSDKVTAWDGAVSKEHTHDNKALLDTYMQTEENLADAVAKKHEHTNKDVLDGITSAKVTAWDAAEQNAKDYADGQVASAKSILDKAIVEVAGDVEALSGAVDTKFADYATSADTAAAIKAVDDDVDALSGNVVTLIGEDSGKTVRTIANEELAKQLIPEGAQESLDTLQEIAAWIQDHPESVSEINANIASLSAATGTLHTNVEALSGAVDTKFASYATSADTAAAIKTVDDKFADYATSAATEAAIGTAKDAAIATASGYTDGEITKLSGALTTNITALDKRIDNLEELSATTISAVQEIVVKGTEYGGENQTVKVEKSGNTVTLDFTEMVIDCGDF